MDSQRHGLPVLGSLHRLHERPLRSADVKGLSRHILAPKCGAPVFHDPLDSLALLRMYIVPITGN